MRTETTGPQAAGGWPRLVVLVAALTTALALLPAPPVEAADCELSGLEIERVSSPIFYIDVSSGFSLTSAYVGYRVTNGGATDLADAWVELRSFAGGSLDRAAGEDGRARIGRLPSGASSTVFFYLTATGPATGQTHDVTLFEGNPATAGPLCETAFTYDVENTIAANTNTVISVVAEPNPPELGGVTTLTVTGSTGTIGMDGIFSYTPAALAGWRPDAYELVGTQLVLSGGNDLTVDDMLYVEGLASPTSDFTIRYRFAVVGGTGGSTQVHPVNYISSGMPVKHTNTSTYAFPPIQPPLLATTIAKSADPTAASPGAEVTYTVGIDNGGLSAVSLDEVRDTLPVGVTYVPGSARFLGSPVPDPSTTSGTIVFQGPFTVPAGSVAPLTYLAMMPAVSGDVVNSAVGLIRGVQVDQTTDPGDDVPASVVVTVADLADVSVAKRVVSSGPAGTPIRYEIVVANDGPAGAPGTTVEDPLDPALLSATWTCTPSGGAACRASDTGPIDETVELPAGSEAVFVVDATVDPSFVGDLTNAASVVVAPGIADRDAGAVVSTASVTIGARADVRVTKTVDPVDPDPGSRLTYVIRVSNAGPSAAPGTRVADAFPVGVPNPSWTCRSQGGATCTPAGTGDLADTVDLPAGASVTYTAIATVDPTLAGVVVNRATASVAPPIVDPITANNAASATATIAGPADVSVTKRALADEAVPGARLGYRIEVVNSGPSVAREVEVVDTLPSGASYVSSSGGVVCRPDGGAVRCELGDLPVGSVGFELTVRVGNDSSGELVNVVRVASASEDPRPANGRAVVTTPVVSLGALAGVVVWDTNRDGQSSGEPGLVGVDVVVRRSGGGEVGRTATRAGGAYLFEAVVPGPVSVSIDDTTLPLGMVPTGDPDGGGDSIATVVVRPGRRTAGLDFGYAGTGSMAGAVFFDAGRDGRFDGIDMGLRAVRADLTWLGPDGRAGTGDDVAVHSAVAGEGGVVAYGSLPAGAYEVEVDLTRLPDGVFATTDHPLAVTLDAGANRRGADIGFGLDRPPQANADRAEMLEDGSLAIPVLLNDGDPEGDPIRVIALQEPSHGTAVLGADHIIAYRPDADFTGVDTFTYTIAQTEMAGAVVAPLTATGSVTVTVQAVNDRPVFAGPMALTIVPGETPPPLPLEDAEGGRLTVTVSAGALPPGLVLHPDGTWSGATEALGTYFFTLQVCDEEGLCSTAEMTLTVSLIPKTGTDGDVLLALAVVLLVAGILTLRGARPSPGRHVRSTASVGTARVVVRRRVERPPPAR